MAPRKKIIKVVDIVGAPIQKKRSEKTERSEPLAPQRPFILQEPQPPAQEPVLHEAHHPHHRAHTKRRALWWGVAFVAFVAVMVYGITVLFARADIRIVEKKIQGSFNETFLLRTQSTATQQSFAIPGEIVRERKTNISAVKPSGTKHVERKAEGTVLIFNEFGPTPQTLVATTRLQTADGKIFRLTDRVIVPAAKVTNGIVEPSSIEAHVIADAPGESYNVGPQDKLTIPGLKGSDKYEKFYAQSMDAMKGGLIGEAPYATDEDLAKAKADAENKIKDILISSIKLKIPSEFSVAQGSEKLDVITEKVSDELNADGMLSVAVDAELSVFTFKENDVKKAFREILVQQNKIPQDYTEKDFSIQYGTTTSQWELASARMPVTYEATYWKKVDPDAMKGEMAGKGEIDLKTYLMGLSFVDKVNVSFSPFWITSVPRKIARINLVVE